MTFSTGQFLNGVVSSRIDMLFPKYSGIFIALFFPATHQKRQRGWRPDYFQKWAARLPCRCRRRSIQIRPLRPLFATLPRPDDSPVIHVLSNRTRTFHSLPMRPEQPYPPHYFVSIVPSPAVTLPANRPRARKIKTCSWTGDLCRGERATCPSRSATCRPSAPATFILPHQHRSPSPFFNL